MLSKWQFQRQSEHITYLDMKICKIKVTIYPKFQKILSVVLQDLNKQSSVAISLLGVCKNFKKWMHCRTYLLHNLPNVIPQSYFDKINQMFNRFLLIKRIKRGLIFIERKCNYPLKWMAFILQTFHNITMPSYQVRLCIRWLIQLRTVLYEWKLNRHLGFPFHYQLS